MRILIHCINFTPELTGIGKYTGEMAEWLTSRGHEVRVITAPPYYPHWKVGEGYSGIKYKKEIHSATKKQTKFQSFRQKGVVKCGELVVYRCPLWVPAKPTGLKRIIHLASFAITSIAPMLAQVIWRPNVIIVIEPPLFCSFSAIVAATLSNSKSVLHVQDFEVDAAFQMGLLPSPMLRRIVLAVERWVMQRFDKISTISARMQQRLCAKGLEATKTILFPNWVNIDMIHPLERCNKFREELGIGADDIVLLYSGNMGHKQGLELVIESARILAKQSRVQFVMCGHGAAYEPLRKMANGLNNILWIPLQPLDRLNELLNLADIHLLPQKADAADLVMPSKLTGILASGRPVIATAAEGTEVWSIVEGRGINTPPDDVKAFVAAIELLIRDENKRVTLGKKGRKYAEEKLSTDEVLGEFERALLALTEARDGDNLS